MKRNLVLVFLLFVLAQARASELFIWISTPGTFEVTVGDQFQKSSKGKFRFFDLDSGYVSIKVKKQGASGAFYEGRVQIKLGKCMVVEIGKNDLYHISHVDCSGNYDLPADGESHSKGKEQVNNADYGNYQGSNGQGNKHGKIDSTDYSKYHNNNGGSNYHDITDPANKQNGSGNTDYSKYHGSADGSSNQNKADSIDFNKYHNHTDGGNYRDITDPGNKQSSSNNTDYGKYHNNTGGGGNSNHSNSAGKGNIEVPNKTGGSSGQNNMNSTNSNSRNNSNNTANSSQPNNSNNTASSSSRSNEDYSNYHNNGACDEKSFSKIIETLNGTTFESQKLEKAKELASTTRFTSSQVKRICELMKLDSNKLDFAKFAYDNTADKENYSMVSKVFRFAPFSRDLESYVGSRH